MVTASSLMGKRRLGTQVPVVTPKPHLSQYLEEADGRLSQVSHWPSSTLCLLLSPHLGGKSERRPLLSRRPPASPPVKGHSFQPGPPQRPPRLQSQAAGLTGRQPSEGPGPQEATGGQFRNRAVPGYGQGRAGKSGNAARPQRQAPHTPHGPTSTEEGPSPPLSHLGPSPSSAKPGPPLPRSGPPRRPAPGAAPAPSRDPRGHGKDEESSVNVSSGPPGPALTAARRATRPAGAPGAGPSGRGKDGAGHLGRGSGLKGP